MAKSEHIIVVGAGPVGCLCALMLASQGLRVTLVEAKERPDNDLRASTFHPPTLDLLDKWDLTQELINQGLITPTFQFRDRKEGLIAEFDFALLGDDTKFPYRLQCEQFKLTSIIYDRLKKLSNVNMRMSNNAEEVEQKGEQIHLKVTVGAEVEYIIGDYLIACDGASSNMRKSIDVEFEGFTYPELFLVVSTPDNLREVIPDLGYVAYIADPVEWCTVIKVLEFWRVLYPTIPGMPEEEILADENIEKMLQEFVPKRGRYRVVHKTLYRIHQRVARCYRNNRVFLAGDSAHINSPLGGMGMNGGLHDGISLVNKMIEVFRNNANPELLDEYDRERRPIAIDHVQKSTIHNKNVMEEKDPDKRRAYHENLKDIAADPLKAREFLLETSMINMLRNTGLLDQKTE